MFGDRMAHLKCTSLVEKPKNLTKNKLIFGNNALMHHKYKKAQLNVT